MTTSLDVALDWLAGCLKVDPVALDEELLPGETVTRAVTISNEGAAALDWQRVETGCLPFDAPWAASEPLSGTLPAHAQMPLTVTLGAVDSGHYSADLCLSSSDPVNPERRLPLALSVWWVYRFSIAGRKG
jgi:hypothetical protein